MSKMDANGFVSILSNSHLVSDRIKIIDRKAARYFDANDECKIWCCDSLKARRELFIEGYIGSLVKEFKHFFGNLVVFRDSSHGFFKKDLGQRCIVH